MNNINAIKFCSEGTSTISIINKHSFQSDFDISLWYSYDGTNWNEWEFSGLTINSGDTLYIRGYNPDGFSYWNEDKTYYKFIIEGDKVSCSGNIMSLIDYKKMPNIIPCEYCFYGLFKDCISLKTAPELPAKMLVDCCYAEMFKDCTSLKTAPELSVNELADYCCGNMFDGCTLLNYKK